MPRVSIKFGKNGKRKKAKFRQQMLSTHTVSKIATKMAQIEAAKSRITLISRKYLFPGQFDSSQGSSEEPTVYNQLTNEFGPGLPLYWTGRIVELSDLQKLDAAAVQNIARADDPETAVDEALEQTSAGVNTVAVITHHHNYRAGSQVKVTGFSVEIKAQIPRTADDISASAEKFSIKAVLGSTEIRWAIVQWRSECDNNQTVPTFIPAVDTVLRWNTFGYSAGLDPLEERTHHDTKVRVLLRGKMFLKPNGNAKGFASQKRYIRLKKPVLMNYNLLDQSGQSPTNHKLYFVARSNIPFVAGGGSTLGDYEAATPFVLACVKMFYYEP